MEEFVCCRCPQLFESDHDGQNAECPGCGNRVSTERRDSWENRTGKDAEEMVDDKNVEWFDEIEYRIYDDPSGFGLWMNFKGREQEYPVLQARANPTLNLYSTLQEYTTPSNEFWYCLYLGSIRGTVVEQEVRESLLEEYWELLSDTERAVIAQYDHIMERVRQGENTEKVYKDFIIVTLLAYAEKKTIKNIGERIADKMTQSDTDV